MRLAVFTLNRESLELANKLQNLREHEVMLYGERAEGNTTNRPLKELVAEIWEKVDGLIFFTATGIAVRTIAPLLRSKEVDPGVLVVDSRGQFVISLLSGHLGGANKLAKEVAEALGATPVITTATDVLDKKSVEEWSLELGLKVVNPRSLVKINSAIVRGELVTIYTELPTEKYYGNPLVPGRTSFKSLKELASSPPTGVSIAITRHNMGASGVDLELVIPSLVVGIGCRQGTPEEGIRELLEDVFRDNNWPLAAIKKIVSVEQKRDEEGLRALARGLKVPLDFYSSQELQEVLDAMPELKRTAFVEQTIGVGAVCEPAAILGSGWGRLLAKKRAGRGVTVAVAEEVLP